MTSSKEMATDRQGLQSSRNENGLDTNASDHVLMDAASTQIHPYPINVSGDEIKCITYA